MITERALSVLAVFAHPDDEVFRCGGTLALLALRGVRVHVLTFTRGQAGSCGQPPVCEREELGVVRAAELLCSCQALGLETPLVLSYEDGKLAEVSHKEGIAQITTCIHLYRPQVLLTWPPDGLSGHPDHIAVSQWTLSAYQLAKKSGIESLMALYYLAMPDSLAKEMGLKQMHTVRDNEVSLMIDVKNVWEQKIAAINCHRTQTGNSPILQSPQDRQIRFLGQEHFIRILAGQQEDVLLKLNYPEEGA